MLDADELQFESLGVLLSSGKEFIKDIKHEDSEGYAILLNPKDEEKHKQEPLTTKIQEMLEKYKDIVSDGIATTLPPRRVISH